MKVLKQIVCFAFTGVILIFLFLTLNQCTFNNPALPTWDVTLYIPLIDYTFTMEELAEDNEELSIDPEMDEMHFHFDDDFGFTAIEQMVVNSTGEKQTYDFWIPERDSLLAPAGMIWEEGIIDSAWFVIEADNDNPTDIFLEYTMLDMYPEWSDGSMLSFQIRVPGHVTAYQDSFLIENMPFQPEGLINFFRYELHVVPEHPASNPVSVQSNLRNLTFREVKGIFNEAEMTFENVTFDSPIPEVAEGFTIGTAEILVIVNNKLPVPIGLDLLIEGSGFSGDPAAPIQIQATIPANTDSTEIDLAGEEIVNLINGQPECIEVGGVFNLGDGVSNVMITDTDSITGLIQFTIPIIFGLEARLNRTEADTIKMDEDTRNALHDNLIAMSMNAEITNHLPLTASVRMFFSKTSSDSAVIYDETLTDLILGPIELGAAVMSQAEEPFTVLEPIIKQWEQVFTKDEEIKLFAENEELYFGLEFDFGSTGGVVKVRPSDYIHIRAYGSVTANTKIPEDEDDDDMLNGEGGGS